MERALAHGGRLKGVEMTTEVIGVVDDDASILRAVQRLLGSLGFRVKTFGSGEDLLASACLTGIDKALGRS